MKTCTIPVERCDETIDHKEIRFVRLPCGKPALCLREYGGLKQPVCLDHKLELDARKKR